MVTLSLGPVMQLVAFVKMTGSSGTGRLDSAAWSEKLRPTAMNLPTLATGGPRRGLPSTTGSALRARAASSFRLAGDSLSPSISSILPERSRILPSASSPPGRSWPDGPWRSSFMSLPCIFDYDRGISPVSVRTAELGEPVVQFTHKFGAGHLSVLRSHRLQLPSHARPLVLRNCFFVVLNRVQFETRRFQFRSSPPGRPWKVGTTGFKLDAV